MTTQAPAQFGDAQSQILIKLGEISTQIAVMDEKLKDLPDHEVRLRALERFRFTLMGSAIAVSMVVSGLGTWVGILISHHH